VRDDLPISLDLLDACLKRVFGVDTGVRSWTGLGGGTRKTVMRLETDHGSVVLLTWGSRPDFFGEQATSNPADEAFCYVTNTRCLLENGVRAPRVLYYDGAQAGSVFPFALVEYVDAFTFHEALENGFSAADLLPKARAALDTMHRIRRSRPGLLLNEGGAEPCHAETYHNAQEELSELALELPQVQARHSEISDRLASLYAGVHPREEFHFIHGELGPDEHLLIDRAGEIIFLDVDNCAFHDLEREYAYLRLRFAGYYPALERQDLDPQRMRFYALCLHISSAWGHRRLYTQNYPDPERLRSIYEWNAARVLELVR
jgi:hypothetical protein